MSFVSWKDEFSSCGARRVEHRVSGSLVWLGFIRGSKSITQITPCALVRSVGSEDIFSILDFSTRLLVKVQLILVSFTPIVTTAYSRLCLIRVLCKE